MPSSDPSPDPSCDEITALDATITDEDWLLIKTLWQTGVTNGSLYRLLRLRARYRLHAPEADGRETDGRALPSCG
jgi:hypothetical protein